MYTSGVSNPACLVLSHLVMFDALRPHRLRCQALLSSTISWSLLKLVSIESVMPSSRLILCRPLLLLPSIRVFSNESALGISWPKYWSFSFSISPSNDYSGLIFFRMDWLGSPCSSRDSQKSSPAPQFKGKNPLALSHLYGPALTLVHDRLECNLVHTLDSRRKTRLMWNMNHLVMVIVM